MAGSTAISSRWRGRSTPARTRSSATSSPSGCSVCRRAEPMDFAFTDDQRAITEAARAMLVERCTPADLRRLLDSGEALDSARWATIREMGLLGMLAPESAGGLGLDLVDLVGIAEAAGYVAL